MELRNALIVDDEPDIRELIEMTLIPMGVECRLAETVAEAKAALAQQKFAFCITDMRLPDGNGLQLVKTIQAQYPSTPVAVITAHGNVERAVEALKLGAFDFVSKPFDLAVLRKLVETALKLRDAPRPTGSDTPDSGNNTAGETRLLGNSPAMVAVRKLIAKLARSQAPVFISGESGTGKELAARSIHEAGPRADKPFVPVNCGAIPEQLMESEFFGHKKGSFTGATHDAVGLFQAADGGTLFLDEVGDLPAHMQVKLLRAIQERAVRVIGSQKEQAVDVRIISASHRDLSNLINQGLFRQDLYYRLNVIELRMPSLRERADDIPLLSAHVLKKLGVRVGAATPRLSNSALLVLEAYNFPGNVRELENILERASTLAEGELINESDLDLRNPLTLPEGKNRNAEGGLSMHQDADRAASIDAGIPEPSNGLESYLEDLERSAIMSALESTRFNKTAAAEKLGITFRALRYRLKKLGME